jgi:predicted ArsR family transcriptional regulator
LKEARAMAKTLNTKQKLAIELLTSGKGMSYKQIAEEVGIDVKQLWRWRNEPQFSLFQEELKKVNDARWEATVDAAREAAVKLCLEGKSDFVKFVLQNAGYNPSQKLDVDADVNTDIIINITD